MNPSLHPGPGGSDQLHPLSMDQLCRWLFGELEANDALFGIPTRLAFVPQPDHPFRVDKLGQRLDTPFGVAAGPHSQMTQNIVVAWLCGGRLIELKTVQTLDDLEISKPCIDMEDEGYNVEWSQELKVAESFDEYLRAWVLVHGLHRRLGFPGDRPGVIFNISVGYDLAGLKQPNMQWYLQKVTGAPDETAQCIEAVAAHWPEVRDLAIPEAMTDSVTLSTMHGCPPEEIEDICVYLIEDWGLHTSVKLNPTLLGPETVRAILGGLGYDEVIVPDASFAHDLKYTEALPMIRRLRARAAQRGRTFGLKLTNTLEVQNHRDIFSPDEKRMYLSGRPLHALATSLAARLNADLGGEVPLSLSLGADMFNVAPLLAAGIETITVSSDLLKSGGYLRMRQYIEATAEAMAAVGATDLPSFVVRSGDGTRDDPTLCGIDNLTAYAAHTRSEPLLKKGRVQTAKSKTPRMLGRFDCIEAPCVDECPIDQNVPAYMRAVRDGRYEDAVTIAREDNAIPTVLGRICDHHCELTCIRTHYDDPLAIREMKRFIMAQESPLQVPTQAASRGIRVAIVGAGPCGLSAAYFLARAGLACTLFEHHAYPGGMVSGTIPTYRLPQPFIDQDIRALEALGVEIRFNQTAGRDFTLSMLRAQGYAHVVLAVGAQLGRRLGLPGEDARGVMDGIYYLRQVRHGEPVTLGRRIGVIGAGDVAMDCARSALRLTDAKVKVIYRRTIDQMPADPDEVRGLLEEQIEVIELAAPEALEIEEGALQALSCQKMALGPRGADGRRRPEPVKGEMLRIPLDTLILAISQDALIDFFDDALPEISRQGYIQADTTTLETSLENVWAGGDVALEGPSSAVKACGDGQRIAASILRKHAAAAAVLTEASDRGELDLVDLIDRRGRRALRVPIPHRSPADRKHFKEVVLTLSEADARQEAARCLDCDQICSLCVSVCPNLAFVTYRAVPFEAKLPRLEMQAGALIARRAEIFRVEQALQVAVLTDFCNECGNCRTFCPTSGVPYFDKPRLYLHRSDFEAMTDNAFMLFEGAMDGRYNGETHRLEIGDTAIYRTPALTVRLRVPTLDLIDAAPIGPGTDGEVRSLRSAAEMYVLYEALRSSMPFLPTHPPIDAR